MMGTILWLDNKTFVQKAFLFNTTGKHNFRRGKSVQEIARSGRQEPQSAGQQHRDLGKSKDQLQR